MQRGGWIEENERVGQAKVCSYRQSHFVATGALAMLRDTTATAASSIGEGGRLNMLRFSQSSSVQLKA